MQFIQTQNIVTIQKDKHNIETPIKKTRRQPDLNTADSIAISEHTSSSLNDIDPQQLFDRFHEIIKISENEEDDEYQVIQQSVYKKLDYQSNKIKKLQFSHQNSSMRKQNKVQAGKCFSSQVKGKQLFEVIPINSPKKTICCYKQSQQIEQNSNLTPQKKIKENTFRQMTAKKESPYRDIVKKQ